MRGVAVHPTAMAACSMATVVINARVCGIDRRRVGFGRSDGNGRVHDEEVFSLRVVVALDVWMAGKASRSRSSFYRAF
jgi:hypothetical protein